MAGTRRSGGTGEEGFSLIEILVSLTILAVGLLGLALLQATAIKGNMTASKTTVATEIAQGQLETFRRTAWDCVVSSNTAGYGNNATATVPAYASLPGAEGASVVSRGTTYYVVWRVAPNNATALLKTITVWASWQDDRGNWHSVMLVTQRTSVGA